MLLALRIWAWIPDALEEHYVHGVGASLTVTLGNLTGQVPFSVAEWMVLGFVALVSGIVLQALVPVAQRRRHLRRAFLQVLTRLVPLVTWILVAFYAMWGLCYARQPALERMKWHEPRADHPTANLELAMLANDLVDRTNEVYRFIHLSDDAGHITAAPDLDLLEAAIETGWHNAVDAMGLDPAVARYRGPSKPLGASPLFSAMRISGVYFPFTAEANLNMETPWWQLPHTMAHEKAHQRGFASEDEANFFGFAACLHSPSPWARYAGLLFAQRRLQVALLDSEPAVVIALIDRRLPGVQRDVSEANAFWAGHQGRVSDMSSTLNDAYLRANRVEGGIDSYGLSTRLILAFARSQRLELAEPIPLDSPR